MLHRTPFFLPWLYPSLTWRIPGGEKNIYLTFDDGPVPGPTEFVLEVLNSKNIEATFFCIGNNIETNPDVFQKICKSKHSLGNHTYNHLRGWKTDSETYVNDVARCDNSIEFNLNQGVHRTMRHGRKLFRPPYGRITRNQISRLALHQVTMWDVLTLDYEKSVIPKVCLRNSIHATRNGSIVVFHDSFKAERNLKYVLPRYIDHFLSEGYTFKALHS